MDRLHVAQQLVGQPSRRALQRRDRIDDRREKDRLHDVIGGFLHSIRSRWWTCARPLPKSRAQCAAPSTNAWPRQRLRHRRRAQTSRSMTPPLAKAIADRRTGVGCDQLIGLEPSDHADLKMRIWNSDGGEVQSCGNATRCVVQLPERGGSTATAACSRARTWAAKSRSASANRASAGMRYPSPMRWTPARCRGVGRPRTSDGAQCRQSAPRLLCAGRSRSAIDELGPTIEHDPAFPERINVNVANYVDGRLKLRTFERGAGETLACGTGACATRSRRS